MNQNEKNVKGIIGLVSGLLSLVLVLAALFVPTTPINGTSMKFYGNLNLILCGCAVVLASVAIVFGVMSRKDADKKGPRKAGVIIGVIMILVSLIAAGIVYVMTMVTDYANNGHDSKIYQMVKDDPETAKSLDEAVEKLRTEAK